MSFATSLSPTDLKAQFARFKALYGTFGAPGLKDDATLFTNEWWGKLKEFRSDEVTKAVDTWLASGKDKWPLPGQLRALIFQARGDQNQSKVKTDPSFWNEDICPCGCRWNWFKIREGTIRRIQTCRAEREGFELAKF